MSWPKVHLAGREAICSSYMIVAILVVGYHRKAISKKTHVGYHRIDVRWIYDRCNSFATESPYHLFIKSATGLCGAIKMKLRLCAKPGTNVTTSIPSVEVVFTQGAPMVPLVF